MVKKTISKSSKRTWVILRLHYSQEPALFIATFSGVISYIHIYICLFQLRTGGKRLKESGQYPKKFASKIARAHKNQDVSRLNKNILGWGHHHDNATWFHWPPTLLSASTAPSQADVANLLRKLWPQMQTMKPAGFDTRMHSMGGAAGPSLAKSPYTNIYIICLYIFSLAKGIFKTLCFFGYYLLGVNIIYIYNMYMFIYLCCNNIYIYP